MGMVNPTSSTPATCSPITAKHWLPKVTIAVIPLVGIVMGVFLEQRIRKETSANDPFPSQAESLRHQNHYKIGIITNALLSMAAVITCAALGIITLHAGILTALFFAGFAGLGIGLLCRDISHIRDLENGLTPWRHKP